MQTTLVFTVLGGKHKVERGLGTGGMGRVVTFERSIAIEPSVGADYNLGLINDQLGRPREAVDALRKSKNLARERGDARERDAVDASATWSSSASQARRSPAASSSS